MKLVRSCLLFTALGVTTISLGQKPELGARVNYIRVSHDEISLLDSSNSPTFIQSASSFLWNQDFTLLLPSDSSKFVRVLVGFGFVSNPGENKALVNGVEDGMIDVKQTARTIRLGLDYGWRVPKLIYQRIGFETGVSLSYSRTYKNELVYTNNSVFYNADSATVKITTLRPAQSHFGCYALFNITFNVSKRTSIGVRTESGISFFWQNGNNVENRTYNDLKGNVLSTEEYVESSNRRVLSSGFLQPSLVLAIRL